MQSNIFGSLFLASTGLTVALIVIGLIVGIAGGIALGWFLKNTSFKKKTGDIQKVTEKMLDDAREESKSIKKEAILEAKEQELKLRNDFERESKEKRIELQRMENRLNQKEETR